MTNVTQVHNVSKSELFQYLEDVIEKKLAPLTAKNQEEKLSVKEVAEELGVVELTIHNYIKKGMLPAYKIGRRIFINRSAIDHALKEVKSLKHKR
ncbi:helix-turn-helix domain-containing protein [Psychroserpens burtonensis]|uniref:helix-turn-helix domain-containing protein n=1 Tax=Psychroserpens burtonensis TaxID=49278 RepID=UPI0003F6E711|nr:helix-turn-helix domain-containing protein [Psychroserpens burtonensis]